MTFKIGTSQLTARYNNLKSTTYLFENLSGEEQKLTLEYPLVKGWRLLEPKKADKKNKDLFRFELTVPKKKTVKFAMLEEAPQLDQLALSAFKGKDPKYAVAAGITVKPVAKTSPAKLVDVKIVKGKFRLSHKTTETLIYYVQNASDQKRTFTLDHIIRPDWSLVDKKGARRRGPDVFRYQLDVPAKKTGLQKIVEEKITLDKKLSVKEADVTVLEKYRSSLVANKNVKTALAQAIKLYRSRRMSEREITKADAEYQRIYKDQARLRDNLKVIPMNAPQHKKFLDKFVTQETQIEDLQSRMRRLQAALEKQNKEYDAYVRALSAE